MKTKITAIAAILALISSPVLAQTESPNTGEGIKEERQELKDKLAVERKERNEAQEKLNAQKEQNKADIKSGASKDVLAADKAKTKELRQERNKEQKDVNQARRAMHKEGREIRHEKREMKRERHERRH